MSAMAVEVAAAPTSSQQQTTTVLPADSDGDYYQVSEAVTAAARCRAGRLSFW